MKLWKHLRLIIKKETTETDRYSQELKAKLENMEIIINEKTM